MTDDLDIVTYGHYLDCECGKATCIGVATITGKVLEADLDNYRSLRCEHCGRYLMTDSEYKRILEMEWGQA